MILSMLSQGQGAKGNQARAAHGVHQGFQVTAFRALARQAHRGFQY